MPSAAALGARAPAMRKLPLPLAEELAGPNMYFPSLALVALALLVVYLSAAQLLIPLLATAQVHGLSQTPSPGSFLKI